VWCSTMPSIRSTTGCIRTRWVDGALSSPQNDQLWCNVLPRCCQLLASQDAQQVAAQPKQATAWISQSNNGQVEQQHITFCQLQQQLLQQHSGLYWGGLGNTQRMDNDEGLACCEMQGSKCATGARPLLAAAAAGGAKLLQI
jgi:hypothetical protein